MENNLDVIIGHQRKGGLNHNLADILRFFESKGVPLSYQKLENWRKNKYQPKLHDSLLLAQYFNIKIEDLVKNLTK